MSEDLHDFEISQNLGHENDNIQQINEIKIEFIETLFDKDSIEKFNKHAFKIVSSDNCLSKDFDKNSEFQKQTNELYSEIQKNCKEKCLELNQQQQLIKKIVASDYIYFGQIIDMSRNGFGIQKWDSGAIYCGFWEQNMAKGIGKAEHSSGLRYEGNFDQDMANGYGVNLYFKSMSDNQENTEKKNPSVIYEGYWLNNKQHGFGKETYNEGLIYFGNFREGMKSGIGILKFADGSYYQGNFEKGLINGEGQYHWKNGKLYLGQWIDNKINGEGQMVWQDGQIYQGTFCNELMHGEGVLTYKNGTVYNGFWKEGKQHGRGTIQSECGAKFFGEWNEGKRIQQFEEEDDQAR